MDYSSKIAINKGWSDDKKYCVTDQNQQKYFLRVSDKEKLDSKRFEFDMMEKVASLGVPMCKPISIELCDDEVHSLYLEILSSIFRLKKLSQSSRTSVTGSE